MAFMIICLLSVVATALAQSKDGNCGSLGANGATVTSGLVYYLCKDGQLYPQGCVTRDKQQVATGQTVAYRQSRLSCELKGILPALVVKGCVLNGKDVAVGSTANDDKALYSCEAGDAEAKLTQVGCSDGTKQVKYGEKLNNDKGVYTCDQATRRLIQSGCVQEGKPYNFGDSFDQGDIWLNCTQSGPVAAGCISNGKRLNYGDRFYDNEIVRECYIEGGKAVFRLVGCVQRDGGNTIERRLDCFWTEGADPFLYEFTCKATGDGKSAEKIQLRCNYKVSNGVYTIEPGCYRTIDKSAMGCVKQGDKLNLQSFQGDNAEKAATGAGLKSC